MFHGVEGNFAPRGLALQLAGRILETGTKPLLGDFVITNYWLSYPMFLVLIFMQLTAVFVVLRPRLHIIWGYALIVFHIGTWLLMEIYFPVHVLLLGLLFVMSPFRPQRWTLREVLCDLPVFGFLIRKQWRISARQRCSRTAPIRCNSRILRSGRAVRRPAPTSHRARAG